MALLDHLVGAGPLRKLQEANANYRFSKRPELYDQAIEKAQRLASSSGIGGRTSSSKPDVAGNAAAAAPTGGADPKLKYSAQRCAHNWRISQQIHDDPN